MSLPYWVTPSRRKAFSRLGNAAKAAKRLTQGVDADTLRHRAFDDTRGQVLREGATYRADGIMCWRVVRSVKGRTNQRDVLVNGLLHRTCGPRRLPAWLR